MGRLSPTWAVEALLVVVIASTLFRGVSATNHTVGGASGWDLQTDLQAWSSQTEVYTGDNLVFIYSPTHDVLEVNEADYSACRINSPIRTYNDGQTVVALPQTGTRYFICATSGHCQTGMKLQVDVLPVSSPQGRRRRPPPTPSNSLPHTNPPSVPPARTPPGPPPDHPPGAEAPPTPSVPGSDQPPDVMLPSPSPNPGDQPPNVISPSDVGLVASEAPCCLPPCCKVLLQLLAGMYLHCVLLANIYG